MGARILIAGAGTVGLEVARRLERSPVEATVTLVEPKSTVVYQPLLPEVASGAIDPRHAVAPLHRALRRTGVLAGELCGLDADAQRAHVLLRTGEERSLDYDHLVVGVGAITRALPIPGLVTRAIGFQSVIESLELRDRVLQRLHLAATAHRGAARDRALRVVVVGAGYSGVEIVGELESLAHDACRAIPGLSPGDVRFTLVEATTEILPVVRPSLRRRAREALEQRGIEVRLETLLESVEGTNIHLSDGSTIDAETLIWCAGVRPHPVLEQLGLPLDEQGRLEVGVTLSVTGWPTVWGAGDCAAVPDLVEGGTCPPSAQYALRQGRHLADNLVRTLRGAPVREFLYRQRGELLTLGRHQGVGEVFGVPLIGRLPWLLRNAYHVTRVPTTAGKLRLAIDWTVATVFPRELSEFRSAGSRQDPAAPMRHAVHTTLDAAEDGGDSPGHGG